MTVTLEAGGADTYTQRAIPGSELSQDSGTFARTLLAVVQVIGLGVPAGRQFGGERGVDEPGDGGGVRAAGIPMQDEWDELRWLSRPDDGGGVRGCQGWPGLQVPRRPTRRSRRHRTIAVRGVLLAERAAGTRLGRRRPHSRHRFTQLTKAAVGIRPARE